MFLCNNQCMKSGYLDIPNFGALPVTVYITDTVTTKIEPLDMFPEDDLPVNWHRDLLVDYVLSGEVHMFIGHYEYQLKEGDFALINSGTTYSVFSDRPEKVKILTVRFRYSFLRQICPSIDLKIFSGEMINQQKALFLDDFREIQRILFSRNPDMYALMFTRSMHVFENIVTACQLDEYNRFKKPADITIWKFLDYIDEHYMEQFPIVETIEKHACAYPVFRRGFQELTGMTFFTYLSKYRLEKSLCDFILNGDTYDEIAAKYGFSSVASFSKIFTDHYGLLPKRYRTRIIRRYMKDEFKAPTHPVHI